MFRRFQPLGLGGQMTGDALIEPALDLSGQLNDVGSHGEVLCKCPAQSQQAGRRPIMASAMDIASLADRYQYLSINVS
jgi:hypothetical protein